MNKNSKTHYAHCERGNECNPYDEWGITACGLEEIECPLTERWEYVTCKNCLKRKPSKGTIKTIDHEVDR